MEWRDADCLAINYQSLFAQLEVLHKHGMARYVKSDEKTHPHTPKTPTGHDSHTPRGHDSDTLRGQRAGHESSWLRTASDAPVATAGGRSHLAHLHRRHAPTPHPSTLNSEMFKFQPTKLAQHLTLNPQAFTLAT